MSFAGWLAALLATAIGLGVALRLHTACGRARLRGQWLRWTRWEYWPVWVIYGPIVPMLVWRSRRHGGLRSALCVNPPIPLGGLVGESKSQILERIGDRQEVARWVLVSPGTLDARCEVVARFTAELGHPECVVLKPDRGERGAGVTIARGPEDRDAALRKIAIDLLVQEYIGGVEFGVFWYREPGSTRGEILSIAHKAMVAVTGDGQRTLEELILAEDRLLPVLDLHRSRFGDRLEEVARAGEEIEITELGTHALGSTFLDANHLRTDDLVATLDDLMQGSGLDFGRFDLRVPGEADLAAGRNLKVIEFNGLSAEAAHIYDPGNPLAIARAVLLEQWTIAMRIGEANRRAGCRPAGWGEVWTALRAHASDRGERGA